MNTSEISITEEKVRNFTSEPYPMNAPGQKRGLARIFCHKKFLGNKFPPRGGTEFDNDRLIFLLENLDFEVKLCQDYKMEEIFKELFEVSNMDHSNYKCLAIFIMTHGESGKLNASDGCYYVSELWSFFRQTTCPTLKGKPKLFFIQACRGDNVDNGTYLQFRSSNYKQPLPSFSPNVFDYNQINTRELMYTEVYESPDEADFLIAYSTIPGHVAYNTMSGSWFMQEFCNILQEHGRNHNLLTLLTFVAQKIAIDCKSCSPDPSIHDKKQIISTVSTLERPLYFFPSEIYNVSEEV